VLFRFFFFFFFWESEEFSIQIYVPTGIFTEFLDISH